MTAEEKRAAAGNAMKIAGVIALLVLAAAINSVADVPSKVGENTKKIEVQSERFEQLIKAVDRDGAARDRVLEELKKDIREIRATQLEILKKVKE